MGCVSDTLAWDECTSLILLEFGFSLKISQGESHTWGNFGKPLLPKTRMRCVCFANKVLSSRAQLSNHPLAPEPAVLHEFGLEAHQTPVIITVLMSRIDLAKVKGGKKKGSFVCSTNTYWGGHSARQGWSQAAGRCSHCFSVAQCPLRERGRGVLWFWASLIVCNSLRLKEREADFFNYVFRFFSFWMFFMCLPLLHISGISFEKA